MKNQCPLLLVGCYTIGMDSSHLKINRLSRRSVFSFLPYCTLNNDHIANLNKDPLSEMSSEITLDDQILLRQTNFC